MPSNTPLERNRPDLYPESKAEDDSQTAARNANPQCAQGDATEALAESATDQARQLMLSFDAFCMQEGIDYFAIEDTLVGAFYYQDLIPGESRLEVGMLRDAFLKLEAALARQQESEGVSEFQLSWLCSGPAAARVQASEQALTRNEAGARIGGTAENRGAETFPSPLPQREASPSLELHVFDTLTDDYDLSRFQVWIIRMNRTFAKRLHGTLRKRLLAQAATTAARYGESPTKAVSNFYEKDAHSIPLADVSQTQRMPFAGKCISAPIKTDTWVETDLQEVRRRTHAVQADLLLIMSEIDRVCRECDIGYFLCAGTLLGAVRYDGFIPWDDDADLGMLRPDYERFVACAQEKLGERFFVQTIKNEPDAPYLYAKVRLNGTAYVTRWLQGHDLHSGISVDIFPFDLAPVGQPGFQEHLDEANRRAKAHKSLANHRVSANMPRRRATGPWEHVGHAIMALRHLRYRLKSSEKTAERYLAHVSKFNGNLPGGLRMKAAQALMETPVEQANPATCSHERASEGQPANGSARFAASYVAYFTYISLDDLLPYREVPFENLTLLAPAHPEALMSMQYGDYLQEPPLHKRRGHPVLRWRTSDGSSNA